MSIRRRTVGLMIASAAGALAVLAPSAAFAASVSHPQAAVPSDTTAGPPGVTVTDPATGCTETWSYSATVHTPIIGDPYYTADAHYTSNPCGLTNGLEVGLQYTVVLTGSLETVWGNDIHGLDPRPAMWARSTQPQATATNSAPDGGTAVTGSTTGTLTAPKELPAAVASCLAAQSSTRRQATTKPRPTDEGSFCPPRRLASMAMSLPALQAARFILGRREPLLGREQPLAGPAADVDGGRRHARSGPAGCGHQIRAEADQDPENKLLINI